MNCIYLFELVSIYSCTSYVGNIFIYLFIHFVCDFFNKMLVTLQFALTLNNLFPGEKKLFLYHISIFRINVWKCKIWSISSGSKVHVLAVLGTAGALHM